MTMPSVPKIKPPEVLFSFVQGDDLAKIVKDAADYAWAHNKAVLISYGGKNYEVHPGSCSEPAQAWLINEMQKRAKAA